MRTPLGSLILGDLELSKRNETLPDKNLEFCDLLKLKH